MRIQVCLIVLLSIAALSQAQCSNFNGEMSCQSGDQRHNPEDWADRQFQTPNKGEAMYEEGYESLGKIACYPNIDYSADRSSAEIDVRCRKAPDVGDLQYHFDDKEQGSPTLKVDSSFKGIMIIKVTSGEHKITLEDVDFLWNAPHVDQSSAYENGQKGAIVELFGWPYKDVADECVQIGQQGWMGVKVYPPNEQLMSDQWPQEGELNPWYFSYQPVSYRLSGRLGSREELRDMIFKCRENGVRVYADAVVNHMTGGGNDKWDEHIANNCDTWGPKESSGKSSFYTHDFMDHNCNQTTKRPGLEYAGVPYGPTDFHCERSLNSWTDPFLLNHGWLVGLTDLDTEKQYVRERIASYFVDLYSIGFSGIRIDAAKHIYPDSLSAILKLFKDKMGGGDLPEDWIAYLEVIIGGEAGLLMCNEGEYNFGPSFEKMMREHGLSESDIDKVKIWSSDYPKEHPVCGRWMIKSERYAVQNDCHDDQNPGSSSRDMQDKGSVLIKDKNVDMHRGFSKLLFDRTDGNWKIKLVMSSYSFMNNGAAGYPDGKSDCKNCKGDHCGDCHKSMAYTKAHDPEACGYTSGDGGSWIEGAYTRVHRDMDIINSMRRWQGLSEVNDPVKLGVGSKCKSAENKVKFLEE